MVVEVLDAFLQREKEKEMETVLARHRAHLKLSGLGAVGNGLDIEVDKPDQRVLVHGLNVCQVRDAEEENGGMCGHWSVAIASLIYLQLCCSCYLLLCRNFSCKFLRGRQDFDGCLIFQDVTLLPEGS